MNAFDEPNVSENKANTARIIQTLASNSSSRKASANLRVRHFCATAGISVYGNLTAATGGADGKKPTISKVTASSLAECSAGGTWPYRGCAVAGARAGDETGCCSGWRMTLRDALGVATPRWDMAARYLHSTDSTQGRPGRWMLSADA